VVSDGGSGNVVPHPPHRVVIGAVPFIQVEHHPSVPVASESQVLGISVTLRNLSACGVTLTKLKEKLEGLHYVEGSARLDGVLVPATAQGSELTVPGIALAAGATRQVTYQARPTLLGAPSPSGYVVLNEVFISDPAGFLPAASGCGCQQTQERASLVLLAMVGLALLTRRKRVGVGSLEWWPTAPPLFLVLCASARFW
jgi:hypothetical protein